MFRRRYLLPRRKGCAASALAAILAVTGCASSPVDYYRPLASEGRYGYSDTALATNRYEVSYLTPVRSVRSVSAEIREREGSERIALAYDMTLWRASELALAAGHPAFEVSLRENDLRVDRNWYRYASPFYDPWFPRYRYRHRPYLYPPFPPDPYFDRYTRISARVTLTVEFRDVLAPDSIDAESTLTRIKAKYAPDPAAASIGLPMAREVGEYGGAPSTRGNRS